MQLTNEGQMQQSRQSTAWIVCLSATLFFFYELIQGNMFASIADHIMRDYNFSPTQTGYVSSIYYLANVVFLFVAARIFDTYSIKKTLIMVMILSICGTFLLTASSSFYVALFSRFIAGIGSAFCFLGPIRLASQWFPAKKMALVTGVVITIAMTGGMVAQYPLTLIIKSYGWQNAVMLVGFLGIILVTIMAVGIQDKKGSKNNISHSISFKTIAKIYVNNQYIKAALYTSLLNMPIAVFGAFMGKLYLVQRFNITEEYASLINSMLFLGAIFGSPIIGAISDKLGKRVLPMRCGIIAALVVLFLTLYGNFSPNVMLLLFFLLGFLTSAQIISYALVAENSPKHLTATAISVISILTQGGFIVYQNLFMVLLAKHNRATLLYNFADFQHAVIIMPIGFIIALLATLTLRDK